MSVLGQLPFCLPGTRAARAATRPRSGCSPRGCSPPNPSLVALWKAIYEPTAFLVGTADDYTPSRSATAAKQVVPSWLTDGSPLADGRQSRRCSTRSVKARPVLINPERPAIRFMGTRFVLDSYILDQLIAPNVGTEAKPRLMPSPLDVAAAFGSDIAYQTVEGRRARRPTPTTTASSRRCVTPSRRPAAAWGSTVYDAWLYALAPMFAPHGTAFPDFMQTPPGRPRTSSRASAPTRSSSTTRCCSPSSSRPKASDDPPNPRDWVEPDPVAFARLLGSDAPARASTAASS